MINQRWFMAIPPVGAARLVALHTKEALDNELGSENVKVFDFLAYQNGFAQILKTDDQTIAVDLINQSLLVSCLDFGATHFLSGALSPVTLFTLNLLKKQNIKTLHWFYESYRRVPYWKEVVPGYDHFFAIQKGPLPEFCSLNGSSYHFLPTACSFFDTDTPSPQRDYDAAFIGIPSKYRIGILESLAEQGFTLAIAGSGWKSYSGPLRGMILCDSWTDEKQSADILKNSRVGLNLSVDSPEGDNDTHISPRVYDILTAGCVLLTENVPLIYDSIPGCHFHVFSERENPGIKLRSILDNYSEEFSYADLNRSIIQKSHTYQNRVSELINLAE
ncbi:MAG: hypothetical protein GX089_13035 [Fibrobacter sp.]|jgi:hypothetical protein|nr:hypothetical protein [Fibrobacter sp.]